MSEPLLDLHEIYKHYASGETTVRALDGISLKIYPGEFIAIMGQSGSGKSTLMNILGCLDRPSSGSYRIRGVEASEYEPDQLADLRRQTFGFVFQRYNLLASASAEENVEIPAVYAGLGKSARLARAKELLTRLGLGDRGHHRPSELSGGQQQRVAIARALMNNPPVILADEPTGALDSKSGVEVMNLLKSLNAEGRTVILITHDENVAKNARRIIHIRDGKIIDSTDDMTLAPKKTPIEAVEQIEQKPPEPSSPVLLPDLSEAVKMAFRSLRVNVFRTALTLLGIIIGVAAVVTMLAIGAGSKQQIVDRISAMGTNLLSVRPGVPGVRSTSDNVSLKLEDAQAVAKLANVDAALPERGGQLTLRQRNIDVTTTVIGTGADMPRVRDWPVEEGSFFNERDLTRYSTVIVLGKTAANNLFPFEQKAIGEYVLVRNVPFKVIGILSEKGASQSGTDQDDSAFVPINTGLARIFGKNFLSSIMVRVGDVKNIDTAENEVRELIKTRHKTEDFNIRNMASILETVSDTQNTLTYMLGAVAAISLLVGGIGVMNIMLVSVTERTREIGIRMATGARRRDILLQFNTEAAVVCAVGGVLGIGLGLVAGTIAESSGMAVIFTIMPPVMAFTCASFTGLLFGYLPARKAAYLDPVIALASE